LAAGNVSDWRFLTVDLLIEPYPFRLWIAVIQGF
jgi:hypothetical protein